jgi:hypothetical protein
MHPHAIEQLSDTGNPRCLECKGQGAAYYPLAGMEPDTRMWAAAIAPIKNLGRDPHALLTCQACKTRREAAGGPLSFIGLSP